MKKTIISILVILPFFLVIVINIAGRLMGSYTHIETEYIMLTLNSDNLINENIVISTENEEIVRYQDVVNIEINKAKKLEVLYAPADSSLQEVKITSSDSSLVSVNSKSQEITGLVGDGEATITVTHPSGDQIIFNVLVVDNNLSGVKIENDLNEITTGIGFKSSLSYVSTPATAQNVTYSVKSNNSAGLSVSINSVTNKIDLVANSAGTYTVTLTAYGETTSSGHTPRVTDTITVVVDSFVPAFGSDTYVATNPVDLLTLISNNSEIINYNILYDVVASDNVILPDFNNSTTVEVLKGGNLAIRFTLVEKSTNKTIYGFSEITITNP